MNEAATSQPIEEFTPVGEQGVMTPPDRPVASVGFGTTALEQAEGEPLDERVARELPDPTLDEIEALESAASPESTNTIATPN